MRRYLIVLLATAAGFSPALAESPADRWNLAEIYPSVAAWNADADKLDAQMKEFAGCKGHLGDGAARFRKCLDLQADMTKRFFRLAVFASEQLSEDTGSPAFLELRPKASICRHQVDEANAFVDPEVLRLGKDQVREFLARTPRSRSIGFPLDEICAPLRTR